MPNKPYAYPLNVQPSSLVFLETYNFEFYKIIVIFMDQKGRSLEIESKVNLTIVQ